MSMHNLDPHISRALQELLAGRQPQETDLEPLTGDVRSCLTILAEILHTDGVTSMRKAFLDLAKDNRPWLTQLAAAQAPSPDDSAHSTRRIRFLPDSAFETRQPRAWLIPFILPKEGVALVFGPPGCGKSFLIMAWSLCIASGARWLGHSVLQGPVAYIAGEGSFGIGPRLKAWKKHYRFTGDSGVRWFDESIILQEDGTLKELVTAFKKDFPAPPVLVVIDTLSRCTGGADENSNSEMAKVLASADLIQQQLHCTVLIVHHSGKDREKGPRGASTLVGNTETIIEVAPTEDGCTVSCYKQKDAQKFDPLPLRLQPVQYGREAQDASAVLIYDETVTRLNQRPRNVGERRDRKQAA